MSIFIFLIFFFLIFVVELLYFKIADKYNIIDHPNHRSSHTKVTIRGGGIIFSITLLLGSLYFGWQYGYFLFGLLLISLISFIDDIKPASRRVRMVFHITAVGLLFYQLGMYHFTVYWILLGFIFVIGTINAVNFMDGINGITGGFGLITLLTLYYITYINAFTEERYLVISILSLIVFNFFNVRIKAKCFAGDVGSVSLAFIILFFLLQLIIKTGNLNYLLLLLTYGLDTVTTIVFRAVRKENIFKAHRSHFYQYWANDRKIPHLMVATVYTAVQGVIDFILIKFNPVSIISLILSIVLSCIVFILMRIYFEGANKLFTVSSN